MTGAVSSSTVKVCVATVVFMPPAPLSSVAVQVRTIVVEQSPAVVAALTASVTLAPQLSVGVGAVCAVPATVKAAPKGTLLTSMIAEKSASATAGQSALVSAVVTVASATCAGGNAGAMLSCTTMLHMVVTVFVPSVTVSVTSLFPTWVQSNTVTGEDSVAVQLSVLLPPASASAVRVAMPDASSITTGSTVGQIAVGGVTSLTVTFAVQVEVFPLASSTVSVTVVDGWSAQVKIDWSRLKGVVASRPQASAEPLSTCEGRIVAVPAFTSAERLTTTS